MILYPHLDVNEKGHLTIDGLDTVEIAGKSGTPVYVMSEDRIRLHCREYLAAMRENFGENSLPFFASKSLSVKAIYRVMAEEGLGIDCVSSGEIYTALAAGFPAGNICFHGNNKTEKDLDYALSAGVGRIAVDNPTELALLEKIAGEHGKKQKILLRITPGIDPHTHRAVRTGNIDSKFGSAIATGQALDITKKALCGKHIELAGFHCHIGSQIFEAKPFLDAADAMLNFMAEVKKETGFSAAELNLGGGIGVPYTADDPAVSPADVIAEVAKEVKAKAAALGLPFPRIFMEPGRSLVADAGVTLYTVGGVKEIPAFRNYVSVDGGMPDNPRYALYQSRYTILVANKANEKADYEATVAGRCCESGDLLGENIRLQKPAAGDILAVLTTGAYNYAMASNYNRIPRPPMIFIREGKPVLAVRRESFEDLIRNEL